MDDESLGFEHAPERLPQHRPHHQQRVGQRHLVPVVHLVGAGHRPAFRPRSMIWVYARLAGRRLPHPRQVLRSKVAADFEGVLPDADGVVRARWYR